MRTPSSPSCLGRSRKAEHGPRGGRQGCGSAGPLGPAAEGTRQSPGLPGSRPALRPGRCGAGADPGSSQRPAHGRGNGAGVRGVRRPCAALRGGSGQGEPLPPACPGCGGTGAGSPRGPGRRWRGRRRLPRSEPHVGKCQSSPRTYLCGV